MVNAETGRRRPNRNMKELYIVILETVDFFILAFTIVKSGPDFLYRVIGTIGLISGGSR